MRFLVVVELGLLVKGSGVVLGIVTTKIWALASVSALGEEGGAFQDVVTG